MKFLFSSGENWNCEPRRQVSGIKNLSVGHLGCLCVCWMLGGQLWDLPGLFLGLV